MKEESNSPVKAKVLEPIQFSSWAAPTIPVLKIDKSSICTCEYFKLTANGMYSFMAIA